VYTSPLQTPKPQQLTNLPAFAAFLLKGHVEEFNTLALSILDSLGPALQPDGMSRSEKEKIARAANNDFLSRLSHFADTNTIAEDITIRLAAARAFNQRQLAVSRKKALLTFVARYTNEVDKAMELVLEIDRFIEWEGSGETKDFMHSLEENIGSSSHFIQKVNDTIPGAVYVFDLVNFKGIFSNRKLGEVIGYSQEELNLHGSVIPGIIHPDDQAMVRNKMEELRKAGDHQVISYKYRIRTKDGSYRWLRSFDSVFKRNADGEAVQSIGISLDIDKEQKAADALKDRERRFAQAEAITHIGSFVFSIDSGMFSWSDELFSIHSLQPSNKPIDLETFIGFAVDDDRSELRKVIEKAAAGNGTIDHHYRVLINDTEKILHLRGAHAPDGTVRSTMIGTVQDVTEKQMLVQRLEHSRSIHKQAEELTNTGSWTWHLPTNRIDWSEQMYKIYELEGVLEYDAFKQFVHPDDREKTSEIFQTLLKKGYSDHSFRIITRSGKIKKLHTIARLHRDSNGQPSFVVGAEQDITEKENLLETLRHNERVYKQAEELANMGNWNWDIPGGRIYWTDQLYRIYGLEPQSEELTMDRFLSFVHPEDQGTIAKGIEELQTKDLVDYTFRIITAGGDVKILRSVSQVQRDKEGKPVFVVGTERDITEKQLLINKLQRSEGLFKQAQMLAHIGNWSWDIATDRVEWSDEMYRIFGLQPQDEPMTYDSYLKLVHPDDRSRVDNQVRAAFESGESWQFNHRLIDRDGNLHIITATGEVIRAEDGTPLSMVGTAQDVTERQTLIDRLQESEKLFKQAQALAHLGNWSMDLATKNFNWSEEMYRIYELPPGTKMNFEEWTNFIFPDEREEILQYYEDCLAKKQLYDKVHRIVLRDGKVKYVHRKGEFVLNEKGEAVRMTGTTQDVTEDRRRQQELKDNQTFIRKITDATPSIIASYNINTGKYVFVSEGVEKLLGYGVNDVLEGGLGFFFELVHPDDRTALMEKNNRSLEEANADPAKNDSVVEFTYRVKHRNGGYRWFHTYGTIFDRNSEGKVDHILNISLDITEQVHASQTIKDQEHFIQQIADASPTILYLYDVEMQRIAYINREIFFVLGYTPEEVVDMGSEIVRELYHPEDYRLLPARKESARNFQQVESMIQYECRMRNKQGEWRWLLVREIVFKSDEAGAVTQILGAALDINKRKEMEKTILQNTMLLEQSNASLEEFAYVASHDLKEPLRKISTFGDRLVASQADKMTGDGKIFLQKIVDASQRMQTMINDLLSISMITGNTAFEQYSLQKVLEETVQTLEHRIEQLEATIDSDPLPVAYVIPFQMRQLFQNLLSNSLKFVREGVTPLVSIRYDNPPIEELQQFQLAKAESYHRLKFTDNGIGFDNEYAGKIFAIFQRLHGRSEYEGSGIGLAICKKIVEHHGGVIYAEGAEGSGASFTIILPA